MSAPGGGHRGRSDAATDGAGRAGLWVVRALVGLPFLAHGSVRVAGAIRGPRIPEFSRILAQHAWVPSLFWAWVVTLVECLGGVGLCVGVRTRLAAFGIMIEMVVGGLMSNLSRGFFWTWGGVEVLLANAVLCAVLVLTAPRRPRPVLAAGASPR